MTFYSGYFGTESCDKVDLVSDLSCQFSQNKDFHLHSTEATTFMHKWERNVACFSKESQEKDGLNPLLDTMYTYIFLILMPYKTKII